MKQRIFGALASALLLVATGAPAQQQQAPSPRGEGGQPIEPTVARHAVEVPRIHSRDVEIGAYAGILNIDGFGTEPVFGLRLDYHLSEDFFLEASFGRSSISDERYRRFGLALFPSEEEDLDHYHLSLGFNALPGEVFLGSGRAFASAVFVTTGLGNTRFADEDAFTYHLGLGVRVLPNDRLSLRVDIREYAYETDILGKSETSFNSELTAGAAVYF